MARARVPLPVPSCAAHDDGDLALFGGKLDHPGEPPDQVFVMLAVTAADHVADVEAQLLPRSGLGCDGKALPEVQGIGWGWRAARVEDDAADELPAIVVAEPDVGRGGQDGVAFLGHADLDAAVLIQQTKVCGAHPVVEAPVEDRIVGGGVDQRLAGFVDDHVFGVELGDDAVDLVCGFAGFVPDAVQFALVVGVALVAHPVGELWIVAECLHHFVERHTLPAKRRAFSQREGAAAAVSAAVGTRYIVARFGYDSASRSSAARSISATSSGDEGHRLPVTVKYRPGTMYTSTAGPWSAPFTPTDRLHPHAPSAKAKALRTTLASSALQRKNSFKPPPDGDTSV